MTQSPKKAQTTKAQPPSTTKAAILLLMTILDTTWRAFVPTIGGTFIGVGLDVFFNKAPLFTIIMIIVGFATAALLITLQIRAVRRTS